MPAPTRGSHFGRSIAFLALFLLAGGCATLQVPSKTPTFKTDEIHSAIKDGVEIRATAIEGADVYLELFDDDLPEIGIAAIWVAVRNLRNSVIEFDRYNLRLRMSGMTAKAFSTDAVFKLFYRRRGVRIYSQLADSKGRENLERISLARGSIAPGKERAGFVFFRVPPASSPNWARGATLRMENMRLSESERTTVELPLSHANP